MGYHLSIDLGTTFTAAAVHRSGRPEIVALGDRSAAIPTVVFLTEAGVLLTGEAAARRALAEPERVAREFKRRLGDPVPIIVGGSPYSAQALMAEMIRAVEAAVSRLEGGPPSSTVLCHPASWGDFKIDLLGQALALAEVEADTICEPEAAAAHYATLERVDPGSTVAVFDLGGGTFDAAIMEKTSDGWTLRGRSEGVEHLGGVDFDAAILDHVRRYADLDLDLDILEMDSLASAMAIARLRDDCTTAKEALSSDTQAVAPILLRGAHDEVRINRPEFESMIRPSIGTAIAAMHRALKSADLEPDHLTSILLVGGSSRIPLVAEMVGDALGQPVVLDAHPKHGVALGAATVAAMRAGGLIVTPTDGASEVAGVAAHERPEEVTEREVNPAPGTAPRSDSPAGAVAGPLPQPHHVDAEEVAETHPQEPTDTRRRPRATMAGVAAGIALIATLLATSLLPDRSGDEDRTVAGVADETTTTPTDGAERKAATTTAPPVADSTTSIVTLETSTSTTADAAAGGSGSVPTTPAPNLTPSTVAAPPVLAAPPAFGVGKASPEPVAACSGATMILRVTNSGGATASVTATAVLEGQSREPDWAGRPPTDYFVVNPGVTTIPPGGQADFIVGGTAELATYGFEPTVNAVVTLVPSEGAIDGGQQVITFIMGGAAAAASSFGDEVADGNGPYAC